ncbi:MAG: DUF3783 domain-containing protein [Sphaerochaetaceae bacterium]|nr:DUF3783 domain-containing protein [Sphaerochaetaceae bacterium]
MSPPYQNPELFAIEATALAASCGTEYHRAMDTKQPQAETQKVVILHGFTKDQIFALMRAVKRELGTEADIAFAMTTPHSLGMQLDELIKDVSQDHAYLRDNPPVRKKSEADA